MRALIHVTAVLGLAAVAIAVGRWLRDPEPGGAMIVLAAAALLCGLALRRLYRPGGLGREAPVVVAPPSRRRRPPTTASTSTAPASPSFGGCPGSGTWVRGGSSRSATRTARTAR